MTDNFTTGLDEIYYIHYDFRSGLNYMDANRYNNVISAIITTRDEMNNKEETVGRLEGHRILLNNAFNAGEDPLHVFDLHAITMQIGEELYDFNKGDWNNAVKEGVDDYLENGNLLILARIEVLPPFRGKGIGKRVIKDFYDNFIPGCDLMALKCFPIQCEAGILDKKDGFTEAMQYDRMELDYEKAFYQLKHYYQSIDFESVPGLSDDILVISPIMINERLEEIELD